MSITYIIFLLLKLHNLFEHNTDSWCLVQLVFCCCMPSSKSNSTWGANAYKSWGWACKTKCFVSSLQFSARTQCARYTLRHHSTQCAHYTLTSPHGQRCRKSRDLVDVDVDDRALALSQTQDKRVSSTTGVCKHWILWNGIVNTELCKLFSQWLPIEILDQHIFWSQLHYCFL